MESLAYLDQHLPKRDFFKGFGASLTVHVMVFALALAGPWGLSNRTFQGTVTTVNLVSLEDIGLAPAPVRKGSKSATGEGFQGQETPNATSSPQRKTTPFVPVKRLQVKETVEKPVAEVKKLDAPDIPKLPEKSQVASSIDKDIEKLIPKPKPQPKPKTDPPSAQPSGKGAAQLAAVAEKEGERNPKAIQEGPAKGAPDGVSKGEPEGSPKGVAEGAGKGAGGAGSGAGDGGGAVASSLLGFYGDRVKQTISRNWVFSEAIRAQGLETRVMVVINREGSILDLRVEKSSGNSIFDESAVRAVRKSAPLPPLPQVITYPKVEISLRFSPEGLS